MNKNNRNKTFGVLLSVITLAVILYFGDVSVHDLLEGVFNKPTESTQELPIPRAGFRNYYKVEGIYAEDKNIPINTIKYHSLDKLGRPVKVEAHITQKYVQSLPSRGSERLVNPTGWPKSNPKVQLKDQWGTYRGYFWNRSHLLADSLGGNGEKENVVLGTRMQNVGMKNQGGMAYAEIKAREFLKNNPNESLLYVVVPLYEGDETIPRTVVVNMLSSDGSINERVLVDNSNPGWTINYSTGDIREIK